VDETIFVSAKFCMEAKPVDQKDSTLFTPEWNIDNVRRKLAGYVQQRGKILRSEKSKESALDSQRKTSVRQLTAKLCSDSARYTKNLQAQLRAALPKGSYEGVVDRLRKEFSDELEHETGIIATHIERTFRGAISNINTAGSWGAEVAKIKEQADISFAEQKAKSIKRLLTFFERFRYTDLDQAIRDSGLEETERQRLESQLRKMASDFEKGTKDIQAQESVIKIPGISIQIATNGIQALAQGFKQLIITNAPLAIGLLLVIPILGVLGPLLMRIPYVNIALPIIGLIYGASILTLFYSNFKTAMQKALYQAKEKTINENDPEKIAVRIGETLEGNATNLLNKISQLLESKLAPIDAETRRVIEDLTRDLKKFDDAIREVRQLI
jgi:hypothetical protein